jgi:hypothetical protein
MPNREYCFRLVEMGVDVLSHSSAESLPKHKIKWPIIEREAMAVLTALQRFKTWIFGYKIHVYCDHNPLSYLTDSASKSPRLLRWALALQSYDIEFHYSAGKIRVNVCAGLFVTYGP